MNHFKDASGKKMYVFHQNQIKSVSDLAQTEAFGVNKHPGVNANKQTKTRQL